MKVSKLSTSELTIKLVSLKPSSPSTLISLHEMCILLFFRFWWVPLKRYSLKRHLWGCSCHPCSPGSFFLGAHATLNTEYGMPSSHSQFIWFFVVYFFLFLYLRWVKFSLPHFFFFIDDTAMILHHIVMHSYNAWNMTTAFLPWMFRMHQTNNARCVELLWRHILSIILLGVALSVSYSR